MRLNVIDYFNDRYYELSKQTHFPDYIENTGRRDALKLLFILAKAGLIDKFLNWVIFNKAYLIVARDKDYYSLDEQGYIDEILETSERKLKFDEVE